MLPVEVDEGLVELAERRLGQPEPGRHAGVDEHEGPVSHGAWTLPAPSRAASRTTVPPVPATDAILGAVAAPVRRLARCATATRCSPASSLVLTAIQTLNGQWSTDMWEHVAVVRELIAHPFDPRHPLVLSDAAHPGFSPYTVVLGVHRRRDRRGRRHGALGGGDRQRRPCCWRPSGSSCIEVTGNERAPFWALLFVLLLWGSRRTATAASSA